MLVRLIKSSKGSSTGIGLSNLALDFLLDFSFALLPMTAKPVVSQENNKNCPVIRDQFIPRKSEKVLFVSPQDGLVLLGVGTPENIVQVQDDVLPPVADNNKETALLFLYDCQYLEH